MTRIALSFASIFFAAVARTVVPVSAAATRAQSEVAASAATPATTAAGAHALQPALPMKFSKTSLGNVMRVFSARYSVPFTIEANAKAPITGDFHSLDLKAAVAEVARQAGLFAIPLGKEPSAGFRLSLHPAPNPPESPLPAASQASSAVSGPSPVSEPTGPDRRRAQLLQERAQLLTAAAKQDP